MTIVPAKATDPELEPLHVVDRLQFLAEPATHLCAGIARRDADAVVVLQQVVEQLVATPEPQPGVHLPAVQAEWQRRAERQCRVLAPVVVERRVAHLDRAALDGVEDLKAGDDLAGREGLDLEPVAGDLGDALAEVLASAVERVERLRPARRKPPFDLGHGLRESRATQSRQRRRRSRRRWRCRGIAVSNL